MVLVDHVLLELLLIRYGGEDCEIFPSLVPKLRNEFIHLYVL